MLQHLQVFQCPESSANINSSENVAGIKFHGEFCKTKNLEENAQDARRTKL